VLIALTVCGLTIKSAVRCEAESSANIQVEVEILVPPTQRLEVRPSLLTWPIPSASDLASGHLDTSEPVMVTVYSNTPWELAMRALQSTETRSAKCGSAISGPGAIPLLWRAEAPRFDALGQDWTVVASGTGPALGERVCIVLRIPLTCAEVRPGDYSPRLEYRLSPARW
jgi:hypothetical protein